MGTISELAMTERIAVLMSCNSSKMVVVNRVNFVLSAERGGVSIIPDFSKRETRKTVLNTELPDEVSTNTKGKKTIFRFFCIVRR